MITLSPSHTQNLGSITMATWLQPINLQFNKCLFKFALNPTPTMHMGYESYCVFLFKLSKM